VKTTLVIDRMENGWAVLEYAQEGITFSIPSVLMPEGAGEGDVIDFYVSVKDGETHSRRARLKKLLEDNMDD
jgi:hypothetical protein